MKKAVLNRLRLGKTFVGYRLKVTREDGNPVSLDFSDDIAKSFLGMFGNMPIEKGVVIDGHIVNGNKFVTKDENNVVEITPCADPSEWSDFLMRLGVFKAQTSDVLDITETAEEQLNRERAEAIAELESWKREVEDENKDHEATKCVEFKYTYSALKKATEGINSKLYFFNHGRGDCIHIQCDFIDFTDFLRCAYNLRKFLNRKQVRFSARVKKISSRENIADLSNAVVPCTGNQEDFIQAVLKKLNIPYSDKIWAFDYSIRWRDEGMSAEDYEDGVCLYRYDGEVSFPEEWDNNKGYRGFFKPLVKKKDK